MAKLDREDLLAAWQVLWGQLEPKWHQLFMDDPMVEEIIWYDSGFVYPSLKKFNKLSDVLEDIKQNTLIEDISVDLEVVTEFIQRQAEREAFLKSRKNRITPISDKPNPREMRPPEPVETTMEDLRYQNVERHWW